MIPSYKTHDPKGWCGDPKRGAALGRDVIAGSPDFAGTIYVKIVEIDEDGYDENGTYFGAREPGGQQVFWLASDDGSIDRTGRAETITVAKAIAARYYPNATVEVL